MKDNLPPITPKPVAAGQPAVASKPAIAPKPSVTPVAPKPVGVGVAGGLTKPVKKYTIKSGDTLSAIARQFNTTLKEIIDLNKDVIPDPDVIHTGTVISVPVGAPAAPKYSKYTIQSSDTLSAIARKFDVPLKELIDINKDTIPNPDVIHTGTVINVPNK